MARRSVNEFEAHQAQTAKELGYASAEEMNAEHDPLHELLCRGMGLLYSPTLAAVRAGEDLDHDWVRCEEAMVLAAQKFLNAWREAHHAEPGAVL